MIYRRRASPLHAARAAVAIAWCAALAIGALVVSNPVALGAIALSVLGAGLLAGVGSEMRRSLRWSVPLWATIAAINALASRDGLTVIWRLGDVPLVGQVNITLEATVAGAVLGLRAVVLVLIGTLYSVAIDPDEVLRLFRRFSLSSALSATIATRMVPVLLRDSKRLAEAQRCRPGVPPGRVQLLRATTAGVLDRALDIAATLEVRGYGSARQRARSTPRQRSDWSLHDLSFLASALTVLVVAVAARTVGWAPFTAYPLLRAPAGARTCAVAAVLLLAALAPFTNRRGIER
jgi:energy-coupling factor transport system permease protein